MNNASGEIQRDLAYLSTHPMYENRISHIQNKSKLQDRPITNSTDDYFFVKTILDVDSISDINYSLKNITGNKILDNYKRALLYFKKSDYSSAEKEIYPTYTTDPNNIYITILYAKVLAEKGNIDGSLTVLNNIKNIYPHNTIISFTISEILIENNFNLQYASKLMKPIEDTYKLNPDYLRLASKLYTLSNNNFKSSLFLSDYYVLLGSVDLAIEVIENSLRSKEISNTQRKILSSKKQRIICENPRRLEPIFGEKDCY
jgi:predicted Zn-dependent protease